MVLSSLSMLAAWVKAVLVSLESCTREGRQDNKGEKYKRRELHASAINIITAINIDREESN